MHRILLGIIVSSVLLLIGAAGLYVINAGDLREGRTVGIAREK